jgi:dolichyl-phosphate-mannose--protein O-mannosyl transferase
MSTAPRSTWPPADTWALILITVAAGLFRLIGLGTPDQIMFDEAYYARDACWYLYHSPAQCVIIGETSRVQPPLGKWLTAVGILLFGNTPFGWRIAAWAAGTTAIALLYLLARRLLNSTAGAAIAAGLLAADFLHFVHSRLAMLDIFVSTFGLAAFLFVVYDRDSGARGLWRPWRLAAGVAAGAAIASKWPGFYVLAGVIGLTVWWEGRGPAWTRRIGAAAPSILLSLIVVPAIVYVALHVGRIEGDVFALPWESGSWARNFLGRQRYMFRFHTGTFPPHPWQSPSWSWPLLRRPVVYFFTESDQQFREVLALGSPLVWWSSIPAVMAAAWAWIRRRGDAELVIAAGVAVTYLPWLLFDRVRTFVFLYYLLPTVPFLCLAVARLTVAGITRPWGRVSVAGLAVITLALLAFFYPVLAARPLSYEAWRARVGLFTDCGPPGRTGGQKLDGTRLLPAPRGGPPPTGWCWI